MVDVFELQNRGLSCAIVPEFGASLIRLDFVKRDKVYNVLQPTPLEALVPGCDPRLFSLAHVMPIGGPIRQNKFRWEGKDKLLTPNVPGLPLFYNGVAWQGKWQGKRDGKTAVTLTFKHNATEVWPFPFTATVIYDLEEDNLAITYEIDAQIKQGVMPIGFGATMLLPKSRNAMLSSAASSIWQKDAEGVPTTMTDPPFNLDMKEGLKLDAIDTEERWFSGWLGKASIDYADSKLSTMVKTYGEFKHLGVASHKADPFLRLTPLTHVPGFLDIKGFDEDETGYQVLGPGDSTSAKFKIDVDVSTF